MKPFQAQSKVEQLAAHLRVEIRSGEFGGNMPGVAQLVRELGVGTTTVVAALEILKKEGVLEGHGARRRSRIASGEEKEKRVGLHFSVLMYEPDDLHDEHLLDFKFRLEQRGHRVTFATKTLAEMRFDLQRVVRLVEQTGGDAWVIRAGPREVLEWFAAREVPAYAMFGRHTHVPIASLATLKSPALAEAARRLVELGHRRIVMLAREERRKPTPALLERRFLESLEQLGVKVGPYNLPDWENHPEGLRRGLDSLFRLTPPTAIFTDEPSLYFATMNYLLKKGLSVPRDVSLISMDDHPAFEWFDPKASVVRTDTRLWVPRMMQWADNVARGKEDRRETMIRAEFVEGGTIGAVRN